MLEVVTAADLQAIMRELIERARLGEVAAARLVLTYAVGRPDRAVDSDTIDVQETPPLEQQNAVARQDLASVVDQVQAGLAQELLRDAIPSIPEAPAEPLGQAPEAMLPEENGRTTSAVRTRSAADSPGSPGEQRTPAQVVPGRSEAARPGRASSDRRAAKPVGKLGAGGAEQLAEKYGGVYDREFWRGLGEVLARRRGVSQRLLETLGRAAPIANGCVTVPDE